MQHLILQRRPQSLSFGPRIEIEDREFTTLRCDPATIPPFAISFEEASERLAALPGAYVEPDGSFSLRCDRWKTVGGFYDRDGAVLYVELRGDNTVDSLAAIIGVLGETPESVVVQLPERGVWLDFESFAKIANQSSS